MTEKLLPCPFCGGDAKLKTARKSDGQISYDSIYVACLNCRSTGLSYTTYYNVSSNPEEEAIAAWNRRAEPEITGETSDGYHTFNELYHHRATLFSVICNSRPELAWKSKLHHDGTMYDGMFIVGIETPEGQATYHYDIDPYWEMFSVQELPKAPEWDGHTPAQAIERIGKLSSHPENEPLTLEELRKMRGQIVDVPESESWVGGSGIIAGDGVYDPEVEDGYWPFEYYGEWMAYRRKPERSEGE